MSMKCPYCGGRMGMFQSGPVMGYLPTPIKAKKLKAAKKRNRKHVSTAEPK